jgi:hypothetical protein
MAKETATDGARGNERARRRRLSGSTKTLIQAAQRAIRRTFEARYRDSRHAMHPAQIMDFGRCACVINFEEDEV